MSKKITIGFLLGVFMLLFFIAYDANAMEVKQGTLYSNVRDTDIIGTEIDLKDEYNQFVKVQYIDEWIDELQFDEIGENYTRTGNTYKIFTGKKYHKSSDLWFNVKYATTTLAEFQKYMPETVGLLKYIIKPAHAQSPIYTDSGDGTVYVTGVGTWDAARDAITGTINDTQLLCRIGYPGSNYQIGRGFLPFDTSSLNDSDTVASGSVFIYGYDGYDNCNDANGYVNLTGSTDPDPETIETTDYDNFTDTAMATQIDSSSINNAGWNRFVLNTVGKAEVDTTGWTQYTCREGHDINDTSCSSGYAGTTFYTVSESGKEPYLLLDLEEGVEEEEVATSTSVSIPCDLVPNNELSMAVWCVEEWGTSTTSPEKTYYGYAHIPFLVWFLIAMPTLFIAKELITEFKIRMRQ